MSELGDQRPAAPAEWPNVSSRIRAADLVGICTPEGTVCVVKDRFGARGYIVTRREWDALAATPRAGDVWLIPPSNERATRAVWAPVLKNCDPEERLAALTRMINEP